MALAFEKRYTSDLTPQQWDLIKDLIPDALPGGHPRSTDIYAVVNAIFYRLKNGCTWRNLPKEFPPKGTVYEYYHRWAFDGTIEDIHARLREQVREKADKHIEPTAGAIDSQSVKTAEKGGFADTMQARKLKVANVIFSSILWA